MAFWKTWTVSWYRYGNGSKSLGICVWWNSYRTGLQLSLAFGDLMILKGKK